MSAAPMLCGIKRIAEHIGKSEDATWRLCRAREIPAFKLGDKWHMRPATFEDMLRTREREPAA